MMSGKQFSKREFETIDLQSIFTFYAVHSRFFFCFQCVSNSPKMPPPSPFDKKILTNIDPFQTNQQFEHQQFEHQKEFETGFNPFDQAFENQAAAPFSMPGPGRQEPFAKQNFHQTEDPFESSKLETADLSDSSNLSQSAGNLFDSFNANQPPQKNQGNMKIQTNPPLQGFRGIQ